MGWGRVDGTGRLEEQMCAGMDGWGRMGWSGMGVGGMVQDQLPSDGMDGWEGSGRKELGVMDGCDGMRRSPLAWRVGLERIGWECMG